MKKKVFFEFLKFAGLLGTAAVTGVAGFPPELRPVSVSFSGFLQSRDQKMRRKLGWDETNSCAYVDNPPPQEGTQVVIPQVASKLPCKELIGESGGR